MSVAISQVLCPATRLKFVDVVGSLRDSSSACFKSWTTAASGWQMMLKPYDCVGAVFSGKQKSNIFQSNSYDMAV